MKKKHGWLVEMLITKSSMFEETLRNSLSEILYSPVLLLSTFIIMVFMNWKAALALLLPVPFLYITIWFFVSRLRRRFNEVDRDRASLTSSASQTESGTPTSGTITVNGIALNELSLRDYWKHCGVVLQDDFLFGTCVKDAVAGGWETRELRALAELAELSQKIDSDVLPENLSTGEKQRACLVRALVKNPDLIIIDEGTSQLDLESEQRILLRLTEAYKDRIIVIVSDRPTALAFCKEIISVTGQK